MTKSFLNLIIWTILSYSVAGQSLQPADTILTDKKDTLIPQVDSLIDIKDSVKLDSIEQPTQTNQQKDTISGNDTGEASDSLSLKEVRSIRDTIYIQDTLIIRDTITIQDTIRISRDTIPLEEGLKDTLALNSRLDSAIYFVEKKAIEDTLMGITDTTKYHIEKLLHYIKSQPIDTTFKFLTNYLHKDSLRKEPDSTQLILNDTLYNYLSYLLDTAQQDSLHFMITTGRNDSISLWLKKEMPDDSSRMVLYDDLNHPAGLWLIPKGKNNIQVKLDENTIIEQTGFRQRKVENLPMVISANKLQKYKGVEMIFGEWKIGGIANLNFNQGYVKNWIKGGESSLSSLFDVQFKAHYTKGKTSWENDAEYKFGIIQSGEKGLRKNEDILEINSKFGTNARKKWYYSALVNFTTQFFKGYDYPNDSVAVSGLLAPAYLVFSIGMDYKPTDNFTLLLSPISSKFTMMRDTSKFNQTKYGIPAGKKTRKELGAYVKSIYSFDLNKDIHVQNKINLFTNYLNDPQNVDIDWELTVKMKVTELINTTISTHMIYDHDVDFPVYDMVDGEEVQVGTTKKLQFKELLSVGVSFRF